jgi:hypothetical protein
VAASGAKGDRTGIPRGVPKRRLAASGRGRPHRGGAAEALFRKSGAGFAVGKRFSGYPDHFPSRCVFTGNSKMV